MHNVRNPEVTQGFEMLDTRDYLRNATVIQLPLLSLSSSSSTSLIQSSISEFGQAFRFRARVFLRCLRLGLPIEFEDLLRIKDKAPLCDHASFVMERDVACVQFVEQVKSDAHRPLLNDYVIASMMVRAPSC